MERAYSILEIKAVKEDDRVIEGIATTPTPDRVGDIVEPLGVHFKNPMPLLWQHQSDKPVGEVRFGKPTKTGIPFKASLPTPTISERLKERVDEAWESVKLKLVRGVSIGFRSIERAFMDDGGIRFIETEVMELSLVTIPANAEATITSLKKFDTQQRAASGQRSALPGVSGLNPKTKGSTSMKTVEQLLRELEDERAVKAARMEEIGPDENGNFADDEAKKEYRALITEVKALDEKIGDQEGRLLASKTARPVNPKPTQKTGSESRSGIITDVKDNCPPGIGFARYAMCLAYAKGNQFEAREVAKQRYPSMDSLHTFMKAVTVAGDTTNPIWAAPLIDPQNYMGDFINFLAPQTIIGKFGTNGIPSLRRVPFNIKVPGTTGEGDADWVGEGKAKGVVSGSFENLTLTFAKVATIAVLTDELVRFSSPSAEMLVRDMLARAIVRRLDITFVGTSADSAAAPAGLRVSGTPTTASSGDNAASVREDVKYAFGIFIAANNPLTSGVWIMNETTALALMLMRNELGQDEFPGITMQGGRFMGLPVITSNHVGAGIVMLVNAGDIYLADDGQVTIDISREATVAMNTAPAGDASATDSPPAVTGLGGGSEGADLVSLWQQNAVGIRAERYIRWKKRRDESVVFLTSVAWGTAESPG